MADIEDRLLYNLPGKYYVTSDCIDCDVCRQVAPSFFKEHEDDPYTYVYRQPQAEEEIAECEEALERCPVEAIGNDGE